VRGLGAMQAVELVQSREKREPAAEETKQITQYCYEHGVITISAGSYGNVIRLLMPLVITDAQMDEALDVLEGAFKAVYERKQEATAQPV
jgi:4-aminobutyrate aminotransferase / (S)-3-amino-2-methylpropionate transaminase / 5-aminovalerate transaminase